MNSENILKYQKKDAELYKVEQKLANSAYKKKTNEYASIAKKAQANSIELEKEAEKVLAEINEITKAFQTNKAKAEEITEKNLDKVSLEDIEKMNALKAKINSNLNTLEKMLQKGAEEINQILANFNKTKKTFEDAKVQFTNFKEKAEEESKALEPEKQKIVSELKTLESSIDAKVLAEYKKKRSENIFPVYVPLENKAFCGFCRMEQPKIAISKLKEDGIITCEHCKRFIYQ